MNGRRVYPDANGWLTTPLEPGDYGRAQPTAMADGSRLDNWPFWWEVREPGGHACSLNPSVHTITEHEDGMITVSPSIVITGPNGDQLWHGYLERGVWRSC